MHLQVVRPPYHYFRPQMTLNLTKQKLLENLDLFHSLSFFNQIDGPEMSDTSPTTIKRCETQSVVVACAAKGVPNPDVQLIYKNQILQTGKSSINHGIQSLAANQFGTYNCTASSAFGVSNTTLITIAKPG